LQGAREQGRTDQDGPREEQAADAGCDALNGVTYTLQQQGSFQFEPSADALKRCKSHQRYSPVKGGHTKIKAYHVQKMQKQRPWCSKYRVQLGVVSDRQIQVPEEVLKS
jgi:hypothetical protein